MRTLPSIASWFQKLASFNPLKGLGGAHPQQPTGDGFKLRDSFEHLPKTPTSTANTDIPALPVKWAQASALVKQLGQYDCGPATVAMLVRAQGGGQGLSDAALLKEVAGKLKKDKGPDTEKQSTRPRDMVKMLNENGMQAVGVGTNASKVDEHLALGRKLIVQVNTPGLFTPKHWVLVDGKDAKGNYVVKDPNGTTYTQTKAQLDKSMSTMLWNKQWGGGYIAVDPNATKGLTAAQVEHVLGADPTTGFKTRAGGTEVSI